MNLKKTISKLIIGIIIIASMFSLVGCGDSAFNKAKKNTQTDVQYVGVREDLTIISNVYDEVNLTDIGLSKSAYYLYGTDSALYFGVGSGDYRRETSVYAYDLQNKTLKKIFTQSGSAGDVLWGTNKSSLVRVAMCDSDSVLCYYVNNKGALGYNKYEWRTIRYDLSGKILENYAKDIDAFPNITTYMMWVRNDGGLHKYYFWSETNIGSGRYDLYFSNDTRESSNPLNSDTEDEMWQLITNAGTPMGTFTSYDPTISKTAIFSERYAVGHVIFTTNYRCYFTFTISGEVHYLFCEKEKESAPMALYII